MSLRAGSLGPDWPQDRTYPRAAAAASSRARSATPSARQRGGGRAAEEQGAAAAAGGDRSGGGGRGQRSATLPARRKADVKGDVNPFVEFPSLRFVPAWFSLVLPFPVCRQRPFKL